MYKTPGFIFGFMNIFYYLRCVQSFCVLVRMVSQIGMDITNKTPIMSRVGLTVLRRSRTGHSVRPSLRAGR